MNKKLILLIMTFFILVLIYVIFTNSKNNYEIVYRINNYEIIESYDKKKSIYTFKINDTFVYDIKTNYLKERKLISNITENNDILNIESNYLNFQNIKSNEFILNIKETNKTDEYQNIDIFDYNNKTFAIWNYNQFIFLNSNEKKTMTLFKDDYYYLDFIGTIKNYIFVADYDQKYMFNKIYLINMNNLKKEIINFDINVYFDSYILGNYKNKIYVYDLNQKKEYSIDINEKSINKESYKVLINNSFEYISQNKLDKKNVKFYNDEDFHYSIVENNLYYNTINNSYLVFENVAKIVYSNEEEVYFINNDVLYYFNINKNEIKKIMQYSEWKFNNQNIYIF